MHYSACQCPIPSDVEVTRLVWTKLVLIVVAAIGATYIRSEGKAESAKNGINELRLHYTRRDVGTLLQHKSEPCVESHTRR
ncbi:hypothetical protein WQE_39834 [Paraburkholderia hospita]|uniref:Uncharacterized protein n=1 Tax=Paraburkholderia hospita TaxID=169430 RepID=A0ABN0F9J6_9BURK|nr:hypothetical protein WQE_39834 [Paraburkholderia hospita]OUL68105.1 hypothetical protein CA601_52135 [Paraburkholderia hospita]OUL84747.1 hypothetical protein CA602_19195 [Paraburkholderia hospita]